MKAAYASSHWIQAIVWLVLLVRTAAAEPAAEARDLAALAGLWASDTQFGTTLQGDLTVRLEGARGTAEIGGKKTSFAVPGDSILFAVDTAGRFRGRLERDRSEIEGFWIQPAASAAQGPFPQAFATPIRLARSRGDRYRGAVVPLPTRFQLYLYIWSDSTGWRGAFRNPQFNLNGGASRFRVQGAGDSLVFSATFADPNEPEIRLVASWDRRGTKIRMPWRGLETEAVLERCSPERAAAFWPRPRGEASSYRVPADASDGWTTARATSVGLDEEALGRFTRALADTNPLEPRAPMIHSCLIERHGRLVYEEYFFGYDRDTPHDTRSASKTFASVLVGAAMHQGAPIGPGSTIVSLLAPRGPIANSDPRKDRITVGHLMTHTSGLACDDNSDDSPGAEWRMQESSSDWWQHTLDLPIVSEPGAHYAYCSGGMNLVGGALTAATGRWLPEYFAAMVARPLGFGRYHFNLMPTGDGYLGGGVHLRPRDLLKIGRTYLDGGVWRGQRIVDSTWVDLSTADQVEDGTTAEGYAWHLHVLKVGEREFRAYEANGNGGQFLIVIPELDMSIVFTAGNYMMYGIWRRFRDDLVPNRIIAALGERG